MMLVLPPCPDDIHRMCQQRALARRLAPPPVEHCQDCDIVLDNDNRDPVVPIVCRSCAF